MQRATIIAWLAGRVCCSADHGSKARLCIHVASMSAALHKGQLHHRTSAQLTNSSLAAFLAASELHCVGTVQLCVAIACWFGHFMCQVNLAGVEGCPSEFQDRFDFRGCQGLG